MPDAQNQPIAVAVLSLILCLPSVLAAPRGVVDDGLAAYRAGQVHEALSMLETAAERGDAEAQYALGAIYLEDSGVSPDLITSTRWYRAAAEQDHVEAQFALGNAYLRGRGVAVDLAAARRWWRRAAWGGSGEACLNLGVHHWRRAERTARRELAVAWLRRAGELGAERADAYLAELGEFVGPPLERYWRREPLRSEAWLLSTDPAHFTLQLFSASSLAAARTFIEDHALGDRARLFRLSGRKQLRWNVVYGDYESRAEAGETLATLRAELRRNRPWARPVDGIRALLESIWQEREGVTPGVLQ